MTPVLAFLFDLLVVIALVECWTFVVLYTRTWPWWKNDVGRYTVAFSSCLGLFMLYYAVRIIFGRVPGQEFIALALFVLLVAIITWQLVLFIRIRREQRRRREVADGEDARG